MKREKIEEKYKWDLTPLFPDGESWEKLFAEAKEEIKKFSSFKGHLGERDKYFEYTELEKDISLKIQRLYVYAYLKLYADGTDNEANVFAQKTGMLMAMSSAEEAFVVPELLALDDSILDGYINDPQLKTQRYALLQLKENKKHVLSEKEEYILAKYSEVLGSFKEIFGKINDVDFPAETITVAGNKIPLTHGNFSMLLQSEDRNVRRKAFKKYYKIFKERINTISACYGASVKKRNISTGLRKYESALDASLKGDDVPAVVYETLIREVNRALPYVHKYAEYRKGILGSLHMYDMYVPLVKGVELGLDYEEAFNLVLKALSPLGDEYLSRLKYMHDNRRIDVYENEGKRSGAFSWGVYREHYVLLNHTKTTHSAFTIAHELGHAMHSWYSDEALPPEQADYSIFVAEIASTTNEVLLLKYLIKTTEDAGLKKYLLSYYLDMFRTTVFRQTMFSEFEEFAHKKDEEGSLTTEDMNNYYYELNKKYYGPAVVHDEEIKYEWARIPHFYTDYYVYKYATGMISAVTFANNILSGDKDKIDGYFNKFLRQGGVKSPYEIVKDAGVDLATSQPYETAFNEFNNALEELMKL